MELGRRKTRNIKTRLQGDIRLLFYLELVGGVVGKGQQVLEVLLISDQVITTRTRRVKIVCGIQRGLASA